METSHPMQMSHHPPHATSTQRVKKSGLLTCQKCHNKLAVPLERLRPKQRFYLTCSCGFQCEVLTNSRKYKRKKTHLVGCYQVSTQADTIEDMVVKNLSFGGVNFQASISHALRVGDRLAIGFTLDDASASRVVAHIQVRYVSGEVIGAAFTTDNTLDPALAAYLLG